MNTKIPPSVKLSILYIINSINNQLFPKLPKLPPINELAQSAKVSVPTMCRACQFLAKKGILFGIKGRRYQALVEYVDLIPELQEENKETASHLKETKTVWKRALKQIRTDIVQGYYSMGHAMPALKEMQNRYNISYSSLRKALRVLHQEGIIKSYKRTYEIVPVVSTGSNSKIAFIILSTKGGTLSLGSLNEEYLRTLEIECSQANIKLDIFTYNNEDDNPVLFDARDQNSRFVNDDNYLGFIFLVIAPGDEIKRRKILSMLCGLKKPVAVLDEIGGWKIPMFLRTPDIRIFSAAISSQPAQKIARYLIGLGHKHIAYISPFHQSLWSQNRLTGLKETYASAGLTGNVIPCVFDNPPVIHNYYRPAARKISNIESLLDYYEKWREELPSEYTYLIDPLMKTTLPYYVISLGEFYRRTSQLFKAALTHNEITAWVLANDETALSAMYYLKELKIPVPKKISVISFDDTQEALRNGLTSYNFNIRIIVHTMLGFILNTRSIGTSSLMKPIEVEGMIIERETTSKLRVE